MSSTGDVERYHQHDGEDEEEWIMMRDGSRVKGFVDKIIALLVQERVTWADG